MKLIVDISPEDYEYLKSYREFYDTSEGRILKTVCNGKDAMAVIAEVTATVLTEIQLELDEMKITKVRSAGFAPYSKDPFRRGVNCSKDIIQQKINSLKEDTNV